MGGRVSSTFLISLGVRACEYPHSHLDIPLNKGEKTCKGVTKKKRTDKLCNNARLFFVAQVEMNWFVYKDVLRNPDNDICCYIFIGRVI